MFLVTATTPENGAVVFGLDKISLVLSAAVDPTTLNEGLSLITPDMDLIGVTRQIAPGRDDVVELIPNSPLEPGEYHVIVTSRLTSMFGESLSTGDAGIIYARFTLSQTLPSNGSFSPSDDDYRLGAVTSLPASLTYGLKQGEAAVVFNEPIEVLKVIAAAGGNLDDSLAIDPTAVATVDGSTLLLKWSLAPNSRYLFDMAVRGLESGQIVSFKLDYYSYLDPGYVSVSQVRSDLGNLVKAIPNLAIFLMISDCSVLAAALSHAANGQGLRARDLALKQYARYTVEYRLLREFVMSNLLNENNQKKLGEFSVSHEGGLNPKAADLLNKLHEDVLHWEDVLVGFAGLGPATPQTAVKGAKVFLVNPATRTIVRDEFNLPLRDPYIPTRVHLPNMWEPRFKRRML